MSPAGPQPEPAPIVSGVLETPCGRIRATPPMAPDLYWRLEWYEDGKRRQTTAGTTETSAQARIARILQRLDEGAAARSTSKLGVVLDDYGDYLTANRSANHADKTIPDLRKAFAPYCG